MGLFGFGKSAVEKRLIETYTVLLQSKFGLGARKVAKEWVQMARQQAEADGTFDLHYAAYMRFAETAPGEKKRLAAKHEDGVLRTTISACRGACTIWTAAWWESRMRIHG